MVTRIMRICLKINILPSRWRRNGKGCTRRSRSCRNRVWKVFEAIVLKDMKYKEAAELLGLSVNTVKTHLARAMKQLRSSLHIIVLVMLR